ncbi:MAG: hypothetical protein M3082_22195, partial [Candidatus Dormibacteraeota bacterium]|nr:hypothetical protein [Candidatus Dormibacteraeota bacterium]
RRPSVARPIEREPRERPAWLIPAAVAVVLLLLLGAAAGIYLKSRPASSGGGPIAHSSPTPRATPKASPTPTSTGAPQAVPVYAPASATPVTSVAFCIQATHPCAGLSANDYTNCRLGGPCKVQVELKFSKAYTGNAAYILKFFDRCAGTTVDLPGPTYPVPGYTRVDIVKVLTLPTGARSAALVAVSTSPAAAASAPLLLGSDTC